MPDNTQKSMIDTVLPWSAAASSVTNPLFAHLTNVKNRKFTREMYKTQRADALSDWAMQNEYNSPRAQMQRYQEAGLNPHLIYGQSNEGATVRSSSINAGTANSPQFEPGGLMSFYDMRQRSAQTDLLQKQMDLMDADIALRKNQSVATIASSDLSKVQKENLLFDLGVKSDLRDTTIAKAEWDLKEVQTKQNALQSEIIRAWELHPGKIKEQAVDILLKHKQNAKQSWEIKYLEQAIEKVKSDIKLAEYDRKLIDRGINPKNPGVFRMLQEILANLLGL